MVDKIPHDAPVLVIGLGRFGAATAGELDKLGRDVLAVDEDPALVQKWSDRVKHTAVLDARNMNALEQIGARDFPIAVVATGSSIEASVLITTNLVDMKVPPDLGQSDQRIPRQDFDPHWRSPSHLSGA